MKKTILLFSLMILVSIIRAQTVTTGNQVWMSKNLDVSTFRNGDPIPQAKTNEEWVEAGRNGQPAWCYYDNNPANGTKYGKLYNWYAVNDSRGLAPIGYHIPSDAEWTVLTDYLGGEDKAGTKMKSKTGWDTWETGGENKACPNCKSWSEEYRKKVPCHRCKDKRYIDVKTPIVKHSGNGTNESGFSGLPGGLRYDDGTFFTIGGDGCWWSSTENYSSSAWARKLFYDRGNAFSYYYYEKVGFSVRCLRD